MYCSNSYPQMKQTMHQTVVNTNKKPSSDPRTDLNK